MKLGLTLTATLLAATSIMAIDPSSPPSPNTIPAPTEISQATSPITFKSEHERRSYAVGMTIAESFKNRPEFDGVLIAKGLEDAMLDKAVLSEEQKQQIVTDFQNEVQEKRDQQLREVANTNMETGIAFLEKNKTEPNITTTKSGLQYTTLSATTDKNAKSPKASDTVTVHYRGTLIDGTEFDSSYKRNQPASFPLNGVIKGWTEGLQYMKTGDKFKFFIPSELAYGENSAGIIGANSVLIFEVELISINSK